MIVSPLRILRGARALWKRDRAILAPLSGLFLFVPQWAILLLVPEMPAVAEGSDPAAAAQAWTAAFSDWAEANAGVYLVTALLAQFGTLAIATLYIGRGAGQAKTALGGALALFGRALLASVLVWVPVALIASLLLALGGMSLTVAVAPIFYIMAMALLMLVVPVVASGEASAVGSVGRAWRLARGQGAALVALVAAVVIAGQLVGAVLLAVAHALRGAGAGNPVALALVDAGAAGAMWAASLTLALAGVVIYRALAR